jgi:Tol biopolymer transport system component
MEVSRTERVVLPEYLVAVDPHLHRGKMVFPAVDLRSMVRALWIVNEDGSNLRQLTHPLHPDSRALVLHPGSGDNDPRFSPDGSEVAFMRLIDGHSLWSIYVVDVASGRERNLSQQYLSEKQMDAVPEWSGDGKLLTFWNVDLNKITFDIVTMRADGSERKIRWHNPDLFQQSPAFFPKSGSGPKARIAYSTQHIAQWKLKVARFLANF